MNIQRNFLSQILTTAIVICAGVLGLRAQSPQIKMVTEIPFGESITLFPKSQSKADDIVIDWGDGQLKKYNVDPTASGYFASVQGAVKGDTIRILSSLTQLEASELNLTYLSVEGQSQLTHLIVNKNKLTHETLQISSDTPLTQLDLSDNDFGRLDLRNFRPLERFSASNNPRLSTVLFADGGPMQYITIDNCDLSNFYPISLPQLNELSLNHNSLLEIEIGTHYPKLGSLSLTHNYLTSIDVTALTKLTKLALSSNQIDRLDLSQNPDLLSLFVGSNQLTTLNLTANTALTRLACDSNQLQTLDLSATTKLLEVNLAMNRLTSLDVTPLHYLRRLIVADNQLTFLDLSSANGLNYLDLRRNNTMTPCAINYMYQSLWGKDRKGWSKDLLVEGSNAETADASYVMENNWSPDVVGDASSQCDPVAVTLVNSVGKITLQRRKIESDQTLEPIGATIKPGTPIYIRVDNTPEGLIYQGVKVNGQLIPQMIFVVQDPCTVEPVFTKPPFIRLGVQSGHDISFALTAPEDNTEVTIDWGDGHPETVVVGTTAKRCEAKALGNEIIVQGSFVELDFSSYPGMGVWDNEFSSLTLHQPELRSLSTFMNPSIGTIDLQGSPLLETLDVAYSGLTVLDLSHTPKITKLICDGNALQRLDLSALPHLTRLQVKKAQLSQINLKSNPQLVKLDLQDNQLSQIDLSAQTALQELHLGQNQLTQIDLKGLLQLQSLTIDHNRLTSLDLSQNAHLQTLYCMSNQLTSLDLSHQPAITTVQMYYNQLDACAVNDFYASLQECPGMGESKLPFNIYITDEGTADNDARHADHTLATIKGWKVNTEGDASGCNQVYVEIGSMANGRLELHTANGETLQPTWSHFAYYKAMRSETLTIVPKPHDGYLLDELKANGKPLSGLTLTPMRYTLLSATFKVDDALEGISPVAAFALSDHSIQALQPLSAVEVYSITGELLWSGALDAQQTISLPTGAYLIRYQTSRGNWTSQKVLLP